MSDGWEKTIGLADMHGTVVRVRFDPPDAEGDAYAALSVMSGAANLTASGTPEAMRQLAAALLDAADQVEQTPA